MAKTKDNKEVSPSLEGTKNTLAAAKKQEDNKEALAIDPSITQEATKEAEAVAEAERLAKELEDLKKQLKAGEMVAPTQVDNKEVKSDKVVKESKELKEAVKKDAKDRKKEYAECIVTGVLIVK